VAEDAGVTRERRDGDDGRRRRRVRDGTDDESRLCIDKDAMKRERETRWTDE
jgi:hypothetical protein